jgi:hypothetical protein
VTEHDGRWLLRLLDAMDDHFDAQPSRASHPRASPHRPMRKPCRVKHQTLLMSGTALAAAAWKGVRPALPAHWPTQNLRIWPSITVNQPSDHSAPTRRSGVPLNRHLVTVRDPRQ